MSEDRDVLDTPRERRLAAEAAAEATAGWLRAEVSADDALPAALMSRIVQQGEQAVRAARTRSALPSSESVAASTRASGAASSSTSANGGAHADQLARQRALPRALAMGSWLAAAASLLLWVAAVRGPGNSAAPTVVASAATLRASLLDQAQSTLRIDWTATPDSAARGARGDVVWSDSAQRGVMRLAGLAVNEPGRWQYQLWIFDAERDARYPVDGGVFDVPPGRAEVLVPIDARLRVGKATLFAVTVERAGGVVVSARDRIVLLAERKG